MSAAPELILRNARIATVDRSQPQAQALAVSGGRFVAVGADAEVMALAGPAT